jgi:lysophospholipase L1-like esterase
MQKFNRRCLLCGLAVVLAGLPGRLPAEAKPHDFERWEQDIQAFESQDKAHPPQPGGVMFIGSSTMRLWKTDELLSDLKVVNRGFGGSELIDSWHFAERIVVPHRPKVLLVYAGSNDLSKGVTSCEIAGHFTQLVQRVQAGSPETEIVYLSIKPNVKRWGIIHHVRATNALIEAQCVDLPHVHFLNVHPQMLNAAGEPEVKWLSDDGLHLNPDGYKHLTELVRPTIERLLKGETDVAADQNAATK